MPTLLRSSDDLPTLEAALGASADLSMLRRYLACREQGLRDRMGPLLAAFADAAAVWPFEQRRALVGWIGEPWIVAAGDAPTSSFAKRGDPVFRAVVVPTLAEWQAREPNAALPALLACLWDEPPTAGRSHCLAALLARHPELLPGRRAFVRAAVDLAGWNQHEWPHGYLGDPASDLDLLHDAAVALQVAPDDRWRSRMAGLLAELQLIARDAGGRAVAS